MSDSHETMEEAFRALQLALEQSRNINMFTMEIPVCEVDIEAPVGRSALPLSVGQVLAVSNCQNHQAVDREAIASGELLPLMLLIPRSDYAITFTRGFAPCAYHGFMVHRRDCLIALDHIWQDAIVFAKILSVETDEQLAEAMDDYRYIRGRAALFTKLVLSINPALSAANRA